MLHRKTADVIGRLWTHDKQRRASLMGELKALTHIGPSQGIQRYSSLQNEAQLLHVEAYEIPGCIYIVMYGVLLFALHYYRCYK